MGNINLPKPENKIIRKKEELPKLKAGYVRCVHFTSKNLAEEIAKSGLDYSKQSFLWSTARGWANESEVDFTSQDSRFQGEHIRIVVFDITFAETKLHNTLSTAPGCISPDHIIGIINPNE